MEDHSKTNPSLHELYTGWAMNHLDAINDFLDELNGFSNVNLIDITAAVAAERRRLLTTNAAYRDAAARLMAGDEPPVVDESAFFADYSDIEDRVVAQSSLDPLDEILHGRTIVVSSLSDLDDIIRKRVLAGSTYAVPNSVTGRFKVDPEPQTIPRDPGSGQRPEGPSFPNAAFSDEDLRDPVETINALDTDDASVWADHWLATIKRLGFEVPNIWDKGFMIGWFANAIETGRMFGYKAGYTNGAGDLEEQLKPLFDLVKDYRDHRGINRRRAMHEELFRLADERSEPTHYVHYNGSSHFVKEASLFVKQGGLDEEWGKKWRPVRAKSIEEARIISERMTGSKEPLTMPPELEKALREWVGEVFFQSPKKADGTPKLGKFEAEELYRQASKFFAGI